MTGQRTGRPTTLGIVGGVASGKSFVTAEFVAQGAAKFDADAEVGVLYENPVVLEKIRRRWPTVATCDDRLNRQELARIVFAPDEKGSEELAALNALVHPMLFEKFEQKLEQLHESEFVVIDAPLLIEVGWQKFVDYIIFVETSYETRLKRAVERGWTLEELARRESRQLPLDFKKGLSDFIIKSSPDDLEVSTQVASVLSEIRKKQSFRSQHSPT